MAQVKHLPSRPTWTCRVCAHDWPCRPAREAMIAEYTDLVPVLAIYLAICLHDAARDLADATPAGLYDRFLSWLSHPVKGQIA